MRRPRSPSACWAGPEAVPDDGPTDLTPAPAGEVAEAAHPDGATRRGNEGTQSIHRALRAMRLLANSTTQGMKLVDVAERLGLHHSTAHRILGALEQEGVVERVSETRRYTIGSELVWLGLGAASRFPIAAAASPALDRLSAEVGDAVFLTVRSGDDSVCADRRIGSFPIQVLSIAIGSRRPLGVSQGGRVILAFLPEKTVRQVLETNAERYAEYGCDPDQLATTLSTARASGYICSDGVTVRDTRVIAVPVFGPTGLPVAAISVIAIRRRLPASRIPAVVAALQEAAKGISLALPRTAADRTRHRPARP